MTKKIRINLDDPHTRAVWETALAAKREVASWPAWKRGEDVKEHKMGYEFDDNDRIAANELFQTIRNQSDGAPYHRGVTRPSYSAIETAAIKTLEAFAHKSGLRTYYDCVANAWFEQPNATHPTVWIGSHVDSVPQGGNYDGLAGVIAGLLCVRKLQQRGITPPRSVRAIALRGEESAWFGIPYIGAKAFLGQLTKEDLARPLRVNGHPSGEPLYEHMKNCGADMDRVSRGVPAVEPTRMAEYWELHIEQGPVLIDKKTPIGIVTDIRGNVRHASVLVVGRDGHSGTVPRELRSDAVFAFAELITRLDECWAAGLTRGHDLVVTSGIVETDATVHGITRIPGSLRFCLEWRSRDADNLDLFGKMIEMECTKITAKRGVGFVFDKPVLTRPAQLSYKLPVRASLACTNLDLPYERMSSGAGHDAAVFSNAGVPTGMIFVRNANGSHNPDEAMDMDDFMRGVEVLYKVVTAKPEP